MFFDGFTRRAFGLTGDLSDLPTPSTRGPRLGLALGGGAARGWAHIGVLKVLAEAGIKPDVIAGCSIGAVVGGCFAAGKLDELEAFARSLTKRRIMGLLDFHLAGSGLIGGDRLRRLLEVDLGATKIEDLPLRFATVATELSTGHELWLTRGPLIQALRASYALPGVFDPVKIAGRWLMDGALVNPVPVTVARALGADLVICVNLNAEIKLRGGTVIQGLPSDEVVEEVVEERRSFFGGRRKTEDTPGMAAVMIEAFNITQDRISRSRLAGDPPDLMISPKLQPIGLFEFHRAAESIELGAESTRRKLPELLEVLEEAGARQAAPM